MEEKLVKARKGENKFEGGTEGTMRRGRQERGNTGVARHNRRRSIETHDDKFSEKMDENRATRPQERGGKESIFIQSRGRNELTWHYKYVWEENRKRGTD